MYFSGQCDLLKCEVNESPYKNDTKLYTQDTTLDNTIKNKEVSKKNLLR